MGIINKLRWKLANLILGDELRKRTLYIKAIAGKNVRLWGHRDNEKVFESFCNIVDEVTKLQSFAEGKGGGSDA